MRYPRHAFGVPGVSRRLEGWTAIFELTVIPCAALASRMMLEGFIDIASYIARIKELPAPGARLLNKLLVLHRNENALYLRQLHLIYQRSICQCVNVVFGERDKSE